VRETTSATKPTTSACGRRFARGARSAATAGCDPFARNRRKSGDGRQGL